MNDIKRIAMFNCLQANSCCTGKACLQAFYQKTDSFSVYDRVNIELVIFARCNGCQSTLENDKGLLEKINCMLSSAIDVVHFGICTKRNGRECELITAIGKKFEDAGISIVRGTHRTGNLTES